jgi:3alpha(or 20beta)-hydroxysteroid dehydrogenase
VSGRLEGRVVLITGGARGIGGAACELAAREGAAVVVADILDAEGEALAAAIRARKPGRRRWSAPRGS